MTKEGAEQKARRVPCGQEGIVSQEDTRLVRKAPAILESADQLGRAPSGQAALQHVEGGADGRRACRHLSTFF